MSLEEKIRAVLEAHYHHRHPFNLRMHAGELSQAELKLWVANRFYYQENLPVKDALLFAKLPRSYRVGWLRRIHTHDTDGGIENWLKLGEAVGLKPEEIKDHRYLHPAAKFAVMAYVSYIREEPWLYGVASSLTELFSPGIMAVRTEAFEKYYPWVEAEGLRYFRNRLDQAPQEADQAMDIVNTHTDSPEKEAGVLEAVRFKCDLLWTLLDGVELAYRDGYLEAG